jgi:hypothetical protein
VFRRTLRIGVLLGLLVGIAVALTKLLHHDEPDRSSLGSHPPTPWPPLSSDPGRSAAPTARAVPDPAAPEPAADTATEPWVAAVDGACPPTHPVKAKVSSKIFHLPGMLNYDRTVPDRCYADAAAAEADGFRAAKR